MIALPYSLFDRAVCVDQPRKEGQERIARVRGAIHFGTRKVADFFPIWSSIKAAARLASKLATA